MTFWINLCQEETARMKIGQSLNIIAQYQDRLLQLIFEGLCLTEFEDEDHEVDQTIDDITWTVSRASGALLVEVAGILGDHVLLPTIQFATPKLNGASWQENYIGMVALGSVMEGPSEEHIQQQIEPAFSSIFNMLQTSQSSRVRYATAWLIS